MRGVVVDDAGEDVARPLADDAPGVEVTVPTGPDATCRTVPDGAGPVLTGRAESGENPSKGYASMIAAAMNIWSSWSDVRPSFSAIELTNAPLRVKSLLCSQA